ncbi:unnamed protein product [Cylicocyclus nassatus]|uniref:Uncharacterized protein n=1 Tax=Cylicocyclus nassatus TaxID=53992 RepID=A0AA36DSN7_CYLNA|nr:unnamed protein product [Cylicocyclus nassatus]
MKALLFLTLISFSRGSRARINREVREPQFFVSAASHSPRRFYGAPNYSFRSRSRVFRNVQVQSDGQLLYEPRLYRASGRFQKKVAAAVPIHDVTPLTVSKDAPSLPPLNALSYDENNHQLNKLTEDNSILEEAAEYAKGLERTTMAARDDQNSFYTTTTPATNLQHIPAIIRPRILNSEEKKARNRQPSQPFSQTTPPPPPVTTVNVVTSTTSVPSLRKQQPATGPLTMPPPPPPLSLQPQPNQQLPPGLIAPQLAPQLAPQVPPAIIQVTIPALPTVLNPTPHLGAVTQSAAAQPQQFPQIHGQVATAHGQNLGPASTHTQTPSIAQQGNVGQINHAPVAQLSLPRPAAPPPAPPFSERVEIINAQAANSSLEQLGCGFDWITNSCKDVFAIGWCGQCHDFGNIFVHDCKCLQPLIALPPRPQQAPRPAFLSMI